jgi:integrase
MGTTGSTPKWGLFPSRLKTSDHLSTRQYSRIVKACVTSIGLGPLPYGTHTMRRTKALRLRFDDARKWAALEALNNEDQELRAGVRGFQIRHIRPKAASEIADLGNASKLLGHTDKRITQTVYRRVGEVVAPTK